MTGTGCRGRVAAALARHSLVNRSLAPIFPLPISIQKPAAPYSRKNPFPAIPLVNRKLTLEGSEKETRHYEFSLAGSGFQYEVGDSMGIFPQNNPRHAEELLQALHFSGEESVTTKEGETFSLREGLLKRFHIKDPSKQSLESM